MEVKEISIKANLSSEERGLLVQAFKEVMVPYLEALQPFLQLNSSQNQNNSILIESEIPISKKEICRFLSCSEPTMTKWMAQGIIPYHRKGRRVYFFKSKVLKSLENPLKRRA